jgi:hypothetical protein
MAEIQGSAKMRYMDNMDKTIRLKAFVLIRFFGCRANDPHLFT